MADRVDAIHLTAQCEVNWVEMQAVTLGEQIADAALARTGRAADPENGVHYVYRFCARSRLTNAINGPRCSKPLSL